MQQLRLSGHQRGRAGRLLGCWTLGTHQLVKLVERDASLVNIAAMQIQPHRVPEQPCRLVQPTSGSEGGRSTLADEERMTAKPPLLQCLLDPQVGVGRFLRVLVALPIGVREGLRHPGGLYWTSHDRVSQRHSVQRRPRGRRRFAR